MSEQLSSTAQPQGEAAPRGELSVTEREAVVMRYWRHGNLTPLGVANSLVRQGSRVRFAGSERHAQTAA